MSSDHFRNVTKKTELVHFLNKFIHKSPAVFINPFSGLSIRYYKTSRRLLNEFQLKDHSVVFFT